MTQKKLRYLTKNTVIHYQIKNYLPRPSSYFINEFILQTNGKIQIQSILLLIDSSIMELVSVVERTKPQGSSRLDLNNLFRY